MKHVFASGLCAFVSKGVCVMACGVLFTLWGMVLWVPLSPAYGTTGDTIYVVEDGGLFHMESDRQSAAIFPLDRGREFIELARDGDWVKLQDELTGLIGWTLDSFLGETLPADIESLTSRDRKAEFESFQSRFNALSQAISDASGYTPFVRVEHMSRGAVRVVTEEDWYHSRGAEQQAFRIFDMWKIANAGQPVLASFVDREDKEHFIVLDGPNRPRLLTPQAQ